MFVIACQNYRGISGMTLDDESFSAYPGEAEVILCEGCRMHVLAVDTAVNIANTNGGM